MFVVVVEIVLCSDDFEDLILCEVWLFGLVDVFVYEVIVFVVVFD